MADKPSANDPQPCWQGKLPGGRYARIRLRAEPPALYAQVPAAFQPLVGDCPVDTDRPSLEPYRRHDEVHALVPVAPTRHSPTNPRPDGAETRATTTTSPTRGIDD